MLTQKQELFTLNIFKGLTQRESWIQAGYSSNYSPAVIDINACRLADNTKVKLRLEELRTPAVNSAKMSVVERETRLSEFGREDIEGKFGINRQSNIQAIAELNKMGGNYAPVKTDHTFNGEGLSDVLLKLRGYKAPELMEGEGKDE